MYAQNTFNEVLGWYGLCTTSTSTCTTLTTTTLDTGQTAVVSGPASPSATALSHDDADLQLIAADRPLDLTCSAAVASRQCAFPTLSEFSNYPHTVPVFVSVLTAIFQVDLG